MSSTPTVNARASQNPDPERPNSNNGRRMTRSELVALYGPMLLALYFVMTSRWGSYVLPGPPYIGDLALAGLIAHRLWTITKSSLPMPLLARVTAIPTGLLLLYSLVVLALGQHSTVALRDAAPYFYAVLVFFGQSYRRASAITIQRLIFGALLLHSAWYTFAVLFPTSLGPTTLGDDATTIFGLRSDIDGVFNAALVAMALDRVVNGRFAILNALLAAWSLTLILMNDSRSALLATILMLALVALRFLVVWRSDLTPPPRDESIRRGWRLPEGWMNPALAVFVLVAVPVGLTLTSNTPAALERSINVAENNVDPGSDAESPSNTSGGGGSSANGGGQSGGSTKPNAPPPIARVPGTIDTGVGTVQARTAAWRAVINWMPDGGVSRIALGVGFGPHYMQQSGADVAFQGDYPDPTVRAVHNFGLNTWARLGLVGAILITALMLLGLLAAVRLLTRAYVVADLDLLAGLLIVGIPVTASLGVVLESPFGAIPYFWAIGYLSARMVEEGLWRPLRLPAPLLARTAPERGDRPT